MSRVHKHPSKEIDGWTCDSHETRVAFLRVAGLLVERRSASRSFSAFWLGAAQAFHRNRRFASGSLSLYELYNRFRVLRVVALRVVASSGEEYAASQDDKA